MPTTERLPLIIFVGGGGASEPERWLARACRANTHDLVARAGEVSCLGPTVVVAPTEGVAELASIPAELVVDPPGEPFHFGRRLREIVHRYGFRRLLYLGGGAASLLAAPALAALARRALALERGVITNNLYSTDYAAWAPAAALECIEPPESDNDLAWRLAQAGLPAESLPASAATRLDLDTPNDLAVAGLHPACGPHLRRMIAGLPFDTRRLRAVWAELHSPQGEVLIYGRASAATWQALERLPCQTRMFSEERGMRASGRLARGAVHAWLGAFLAQTGPHTFFQSLAGTCTAALLDSRVLFAHLGLWPSAADRFHSDLLQPERIADPTVRAFTEAALAAPVPLLLGGQGLVSGDLLALAEMSSLAP